MNAGDPFEGMKAESMRSARRLDDAVAGASEVPRGRRTGGRRAVIVAFSLLLGLVVLGGGVIAGYLAWVNGDRKSTL